MRRRETHHEYRARLKRFKGAKAKHAFYDTGLGRLLPDAQGQMDAAMVQMWEEANGTARDEKPLATARSDLSR